MKVHKLDIIGNKNVGCGKWLSEYIAWKYAAPTTKKQLFTNTEAIYPSIKQVISNNVY